MLNPLAAKAKDLMQTDLLRFSASAPIEEVIESLEEYHVSGAPVVNESEEIVGVISASDIVRSDHIEEGKVASHQSDYAPPEDLAGEEPPALRENYSTPTLGRETVGDWMTVDVVCVDPDTSLRDVCRIMEAQSIHRIFVSKGKRLLGLISSSDVVRWVAGS